MLTEHDLAFTKAYNKLLWRRCSTVDLVCELEWLSGELTEANDRHDEERITGCKAEMSDLEAEITRRMGTTAFQITKTSLIPDDLIERIKADLDIVALVKQDRPWPVVSSRRDVAFVSCPFHAENHPSLLVSNERHRFHCFGCGADGDFIQWLMQLRNMTFREAIEHGGELTGIRAPEREVKHYRGENEQPEWAEW